tara:strand:- start:154 stop:735 length:582 start_codon:yes stop_codon:yes gene_type:complete
MNTSLQLYERIPDKYIQHKKDFNPNNYLSIQDRVNNDPEFEQEYFAELITKGWVKLARNSDILYYPPGETFKYRLNGNSMSKAEEGTFRSGGFIVGKPLDSNDYILYKAYNGCIFSLQINDIQDVYVKDIRQKMIIFNPPGEPTNNPVYLPHPDTGEQTIVYYGKKPKDSKKFTSTKKFQTAIKYGNWQFKNQ